MFLNVSINIDARLYRASGSRMARTLSFQERAERHKATKSFLFFSR